MDAHDQLGLFATGRVRRDQGMARVWDGTPDEWKRQALDALYALAKMHPAPLEFGADDLRAMVGDPPRQNAIGVVFHIARQNGWIRKSRVVQARRPSRNATTYWLWVGTRSVEEAASDG